MWNSIRKVLVGFVLLPVQVNLFELGDQIDTWEMLDKEASSIVEQKHSASWLEEPVP